MKNIRYLGNQEILKRGRNEAKMLITDNFTTVMPYIRWLQIYLCEMKNIRYLGNQALQKGAKWGQNTNYRQFHYGNAIYSLQVEHNRYISSLQI